MSARRLHRVCLPLPLSAVEAFQRLCGLPGCAWLDSARPNPDGDARWSLLCAQPFARLRLHNGRLEHSDYRSNTTVQLHGDPLDALEQLLQQYGLPPQGTTDAMPEAAASTAPFFACGGGAVGYFSYELGRQWEAHQPLPTPTPAFPRMDWAFYDRACLFDHKSGCAQVVACSTVSEAKAGEAAQEWLALLCPAHGQQPTATPQIPTSNPPPAQLHTLSVLTACDDSEPQRRSAYLQAVEKTRSYIASGDIYQTNIAQHFDAPLHCTASDLYLRLRELNPAPYAAYIDTGEHQILSSSPELFLQRRGQHLRTRPIKGTRPRGNTAQQDQRQRDELLASEKERAELLMIVDLERNDFGRICKAGSVRVDALYRVESYATVHHLVADVSGTQRNDTSLRQLLRATFPGGSITGAPKVRAMEVIDELEGRERGIFCGAIGALSFDSAIDLNIAIRTLLCAPDPTAPSATPPAASPTAPSAASPATSSTDAPAQPAARRVHFAAGAGLVWDSSSQHEYEETLHKAHALLAAIAHAPRKC